jgi:hypothetical protein
MSKKSFLLYISLEDRFLGYCNRYFDALAESTDCELIFEQANCNIFRQAWLNKENSIKGVFRSKRFVEHYTILERCLNWCSDVAPVESIPNFNIDEILVLADFPETFHSHTLPVLSFFFSLFILFGLSGPVRSPVIVNKKKTMPLDNDIPPCSMKSLMGVYHHVSNLPKEEFYLFS